VIELTVAGQIGRNDGGTGIGFAKLVRKISPMPCLSGKPAQEDPGAHVDMVALLNRQEEVLSRFPSPRPSPMGEGEK